MNYYTKIKNELLNYEITKKVKEYSVNRNELTTYYNVGKILIEAGKKYGESIIKKYSLKLKNELNIKYDTSSLNKMKKFYMLIEKMATVSPKLSYSHYVELLPYNDITKIKYYIKISEEQNLSIRQLRERIKQKEYERLPKSTKNKLLISEEKYEITDFVKDPIIIKNTTGNEIIKEKLLQKLILEDLDDFMKQLGDGFSYIGSEYKMKVDNTYNYIDLLLFNIEYNSYVVIELKTTKLNKNHIGQIQVYMNYIDSHLKKITQNKTIGIIISKENNNYVVKYCSDSKIFNTTYKIQNDIY